ncbi:MAG: sodium-dependent transporter [Simkaniaceae bacterium]|nr:MAG: sodium-dependent transporter [Simkaniaceae bacterium]
MNQTREHWTGRIGFLMAAIGSAIGLGILWKFPYTVGENGGGLFLLSYLICLVIVGIPIFIAEIILGRSSQRAAVGAYEYHDPKKGGWKVVGWFGVLASFLIMSFYSVIAGWGMSYILMSLNGFYQNMSGEEVAAAYGTLMESGDISLFWHFLFTLITTAIVLTGVRKGIERWAKFMTKALLALLVLLFLYTLTLDGFGKAVNFIFHPNAADFKLTSVIEALGLAFWTLSIGQGIMISYGSYMKRTNSIVQMSGIVAFSVIVVAVLAALVIFPVVFTFDLPPQAGPGLIFQTLPYLFAKLPGSLVLSTMFFSLFVFTALTSAIPLIEVVATNIMELKGLSRKKAAIFVGSATFLFGIPSAFSGTSTVFPDWTSIYGMDFLKTIDSLVSIWVIPVGGLLSAIFVGWVMDRKVSHSEFAYGSRVAYLYGPWRFFMRWIVPLTIFIIIVQKSGLYDFDQLLKGGG